MPKNDMGQRLLGPMQDKYGADKIMMASDMPRRPTISSGSLALDLATGVGGFPSDRAMEIAGAEGTGKTTLGLLAMANFLDANPTRGAIILDTEHKLESSWVRQLVGAERESRTVVLWPRSAEQATNMYIDAVGGNEKKKIPAGQICFAMLDSIGGSPTSRRNEDYEVSGFGGNSLAITEFANVATGFSRIYQCATLGINQVREDMSGYHRHLTPGGRGWKHACALRLLVKKGKGKLTEKINDEDVQIGYEVAVKVVKNGMAAEGRTCSYWFHNVPTERYGFGVDRIEEIARLGVLTGVIERKGGWYYHPQLPLDKGEARILGRDRLLDYLRLCPDPTRSSISQEITDRLKSGAYLSAVAPISDPEAPIEHSPYPNLLAQGEFDG